MEIGNYIDACRDGRIITGTDAHFTRVEKGAKGLTVTKAYDVEPVLRRAEFFRAFNRDSNGFSQGRGFRHVACIPTHVAIEIMRIADNDPVEEDRLIKKWVREHPEFSTVDNVNSF